MRPFEISLLVISLLSILYLQLRKNRVHKNIKLAIILSLLTAHTIFEGYRWQMIPIYFISLIIAFCIYKEFKLLNGKWFLKSFKVVCLLIILLIGFLLPTTLPILELPNPSGKYKIGAQYFHLKTNREEIITENPNDKRELMIKAWYPASIKNETKEPYLNNGERISFAAKYNLPNSTFNYLNYVETNTYLEPKVYEEKFPVLIFSHGSYSIASGYYAVIEEIVSHGYIVLNINHTYESTGTLFPNDSLKLFNQEYDKKSVSNKKMAELAWKSHQEYNNAKNDAEQFLVSKNILKNYIAAEISKRWSKDIVSVIDELQNWNQNSFLANHLDLSKIGAIGHSQGASAIGQAILDDPRISAGINLDGVQWGKMIDTTLVKPFLLLSSDWKNTHPNFNKYAYQNGSTSAFYKAKIINAGHASFMDIPLMINIPRFNEAGKIKPNEAYKTINKVVLSFFDKYLKNKETDLLKLSSKYKSLKINKK